MAADTPKIVLTPQERSHYFNRRECVANEPLKVGRSVDRRRISPNNLIFDCRVLSRNHAQIWFEDGKVRGLCSADGGWLFAMQVDVSVLAFKAVFPSWQK